MEKNNYKVIAVAALLFAVFTMTIGFAAFSKVLNIKESSAAVSPTDKFSSNVKFDVQSLSCQAYGDAQVISSGQLDVNGNEWSGLSVSLKAPSAYVTCSVKVTNESTFDAYLAELNFASPLSCSYGENIQIDQNFSNGICGENGIVATISDGNKSTSVNGVRVFDSSSTTSDSVISANSESTITFKIEYPNSAPVVDAIDSNINVTIPSITLLYKSSNE